MMSEKKSFKGTIDEDVFRMTVKHKGKFRRNGHNLLSRCKNETVKMVSMMIC